jgi:hypothetical protein
LSQIQQILFEALLAFQALTAFIQMGLHGRRQIGNIDNRLNELILV